MKKIRLLILLLSTSLFGQTKIDSIFSIEFPSEYETYELIEQNVKVLGFYSNNTNDSFVVIRLSYLNEGTEINI